MATSVRTGALRAADCALAAVATERLAARGTTVRTPATLKTSPTHRAVAEACRPAHGLDAAELIQQLLERARLVTRVHVGTMHVLDERDGGRVLFGHLVP